MKQTRLQRIKRWLFGSKEYPQQYMHHIVLLMGSLVYLYAAIINYLYSFSHIINIVIQAAFVPGILVVWYRSRWRNEYRQMAILFMFLITLISLPINWLFNSGSLGPTYFLSIGALMYFSVAFRDFGLYRRLGQFFAIALPIPLIFLEQCFPLWIYQYPSNSARILDMTTSYVVLGGFLILMVNSFGKRFMLEHAKSEALAQQLRQLSERDALTELYNRRALTNYFAVWQKTQQSISIVSIDLDNFKEINDQWGHSYGDTVLKTFADLLDDFASDNRSLAFRVGGEEFIVLLPFNIDHVDNLLAIFKVNLTQVEFPNGPVTFSSGITQVNPNESQDQALHRVDSLLYQAKDQGRNCIVCDSKMDSER